MFPGPALDDLHAGTIPGRGEGAMEGGGGDIVEGG